MDRLKRAVRAFGARHADRDGIACTPVPGLLLKCIGSPHANLNATSRPLLIVVLQGSKRLTVGRQEQTILAGQSVIVKADMPVVTRTMQASRSEPYLAMAIELKIALLREISAHLGLPAAETPPGYLDLAVQDCEPVWLDCLSRLVQLIDRPESIPLLEPGLSREMHYWLLSGSHGAALRALAHANGHQSRIGAAVAAIRSHYRTGISIADLAAIAGMSATSFHRHFKRITSLTPLQYLKRLRLIEARRLMLDEGYSASSAAFEVGYESVSQFTREYGRLFLAPPKRHVLSVGKTPDESQRGSRADSAV